MTPLPFLETIRSYVRARCADRRIGLECAPWTDSAPNVKSALLARWSVTGLFRQSVAPGLRHAGLIHRPTGNSTMRTETVRMCAGSRLLCHRVQSGTLHRGARNHPHRGAQRGKTGRTAERVLCDSIPTLRENQYRSKSFLTTGGPCYHNYPVRAHRFCVRSEKIPGKNRSPTRPF